MEWPIIIALGLIVAVIGSLLRIPGGEFDAKCTIVHRQKETWETELDELPDEVARQFSMRKL